MIREVHENPHMVTFHVTERLTDSNLHSFGSKDWKKSDEADNSWILRAFRFILGLAAREYHKHEMAERTKNAGLIGDLFEIKGVVHVYLAQYEITVTKAKAYEWFEIEPAVEALLKKYGLE